MAERRYNEKELAAILRAAGEAQSKDVGGSSDADGLTLAEITKLATEVGIDPAYIDIAAKELHQSPPKKFYKGGAPVQQVIERTIEGTFSDTEWEEVVAEMRLTFGTAGTASVVGTSREWSGGSDFNQAHVSAAPRNGKTRIRVSLRQDGMLVVGWMLGFFSSFFSSIALGVTASKGFVYPIPVFWIILSVIVAIFFLVNQILSRGNMKHVAMVHSLLDRVGQLAMTDEKGLAERLQNAGTEHQESQPTIKQTP